MTFSGQLDRLRGTASAASLALPTGPAISHLSRASASVRQVVIFIVAVRCGGVVWRHDGVRGVDRRGQSGGATTPRVGS
jgi:hypothetical protein